MNMNNLLIYIISKTLNSLSGVESTAIVDELNLRINQVLLGVLTITRQFW